MSEDTGSQALSNVISIDDARIRGHLDNLVRGTVEERLNALLDAEAERLINAGKYERKLSTKAGDVTLKMPKFRHSTLDNLRPIQYCRLPTVANFPRYIAFSWIKVHAERTDIMIYKLHTLEYKQKAYSTLSHELHLRDRRCR